MSRKPVMLQNSLKYPKHLLRKAKVLVVQEYVQSDFDWRVGILRNEVIIYVSIASQKVDGK